MLLFYYYYLLIVAFAKELMLPTKKMQYVSFCKKIYIID